MNARFATYAASNLLSGVASLLSVLVLARLLPAEQYGEYVTVLVVTTLCQTAAFSWLQSSITRLHGEETDENGRARFAAAVLFGFILSAIIVSAVWTIGLLVLRLWSTDRTWLGVAGLSVLLSGAWATVGLSWNRVAESLAFCRGPDGAGAWRSRLAIAGLAWRPGDPLVALAALSAASMLAAASRRFRSAARSCSGVNSPRLREIWTYGGPVTGVHWDI